LIKLIENICFSLPDDVTFVRLFDRNRFMVLSSPLHDQQPGNSKSGKIQSDAGRKRKRKTK
jgi:hypothetical protein